MSPRCAYRRHPRPEPVPGAPALDVRDAVAWYPHAAAPALVGVGVSVPVGARFALVGHNGAGKSTLLKVVAGLLPLASGVVEVFGHPLELGRHAVAFLPQRAEIDWRFPIAVRDLVLTGRYPGLGWLARPGPADRARVAAELERLGIADLGDRQIGRLSGGQQQRALLARALVQDAPLLLLDEPLSAVDVDTRAVVAGVLDGLRQSGTTVIIATHDLGRLEADFDGVLYMHEGRVVAQPDLESPVAHAHAPAPVGIPR